MQTEHPGTLIKDWLDSEGKRAAWLADKTGMSQAHLSLVLSQQKGMSPLTAQRVANVTNIDVRKLLGLTIPPQESRQDGAAA